MSWVELVACDGHRLDAFTSGNFSDCKAGLVVIQEIFGVNQHIQKVCEEYSAKGYFCIAPAIFDRLEKKVELNYDKDGIDKGQSLKAKLPLIGALRDINAACSFAAKARKVGILGFCYGGTLSWVSAASMGFVLEWNPLQAAVAYYGSQIFEHNKRIFGVNEDSGEIAAKGKKEEETVEEVETLQCPVMLHFGGKDPTTPQKEIDLLKASHPKAEMEIHTYPNAGHGFNCDMRDDFNQQSADLAKERTLSFLSSHLSQDNNNDK